MKLFNFVFIAFPHCFCFLCSSFYCFFGDLSLLLLLLLLLLCWKHFIDIWQISGIPVAFCALLGQLSLCLGLGRCGYLRFHRLHFRIAKTHYGSNHSVVNSGNNNKPKLFRFSGVAGSVGPQAPRSSAPQRMISSNWTMKFSWSERREWLSGRLNGRNAKCFNH